MARDRITEITVKFSDQGGTDVLYRRYVMVPPSTFIEANNPQGLIPGNLKVWGDVFKFEDLTSQSLEGCNAKVRR